MKQAAAALRDIRGLDPAPWWPPPFAGWLLLAAILLALAVMAFGYRRRRAERRWRQAVAGRLRQLRLGLEGMAAQEAAGELSELLRRIAIAYGGRRACAGLVGEAWLAWLERHDPGRFPWRRRGRWLLELPYAPRRHEPLGAAPLAPLVRAAEVWLTRPPAGG